MTVTWDNFKRLVDDEIAKQGADGSLRLECIRFASHGRETLSIEITDLDRGPEAALQVWNS